MSIESISTPAQIAASFRAIHELRPHVTSPDQLVQQVERQFKVGYTLVGIREGEEYVSVTGFRLMEFLAWGKVIYIDDLVTLPEARGKGHGGMLLDYVRDRAIEHNCDAVHLDTGYARHLAHRLYLNKGFQFSSHHLALNLRSK
ncbi:MAG: GNAT family N-acetyltransferase [Anaerolineae bacterium]|nr:GNAT family N-acetyltransferase [Anaerolineae bacterium]